MAINSTAVVAAFGKYYIDSGQNASRLVKRLYLPFETLNEFQPIPTDDTRYRTTKGILTRILQGFQKAFTPLGTLTREPVEI